MGYRSNFAIQFINQKEADRFIQVYEKHYNELVNSARYENFWADKIGFHKYEVETYSLFYDDYEPDYINEFEEVTYYWEARKFYTDYYPWIDALVDVLETNDFSCIFIRTGDDEGDIENKKFGPTMIREPIFLTIYGYADAIGYSKKELPFRK